MFYMELQSGIIYLLKSSSSFWIRLENTYVLQNAVNKSANEDVLKFIKLM